MDNIYDRYLEAEILSADPWKLVSILYRGAIEAVGAARRHLDEGNILERSRKITKAAEIINQLMLSVDHSSGGELSHNLVELYAYMQTRLIEGNTQQSAEPLEEVERLLGTLLEAWRAAAPAPVPAAPATEYVPVSEEPMSATSAETETSSAPVVPFTTRLDPLPLATVESRRTSGKLPFGVSVRVFPAPVFPKTSTSVTPFRALAV